MIWGYMDVRKRGLVVTGHPELHRTDVTVYTEAGAAFFDGRDPYAVENPRGWHYLYPPLFGLTAAPLSVFDSVSQTVIFFAASVALAFASFFEARRLWRRLARNDHGARPRGSPHLWIVTCAALTVVLPTLECLQRGQVGIAITYVMLLGLRLAIEARGWPGRVLAGLVLAWPVAIKLIPALPVGFLLWQAWSEIFARARSRESVSAAGALTLGVVAGLVIFLFLIPATLLGWERNLGYLRTWADKVVSSDDAGQIAKFHIDSTTNQSLSNAVYRLAATVRPLPLDEKSMSEIRFARNPIERQWADDRAVGYLRRADITARRFIQLTQGLVVLVLLTLGVKVRSDDSLGQAAAYGLAALAMFLLSPVAWTHYHMMMLPAVLFVPLWLAQHRRVGLARAAAAVPSILVCAHFLFKPWAGPIGLLGLGLTAWFFVACVLMIRQSRTLATAELFRVRARRTLAESPPFASSS
jgi:hypothetical protein